MHIGELTPYRNLRSLHVAWLAAKFGKSVTIKPSWCALFVSLERLHLTLLFPDINWRSGGLALLDPYGNIHQIKPDDPMGDVKYLTVCAQPAYFDWCDDADTVVITEGWGKAIAVELVPNCNAIALAGVANWQQDLEEIKRYCANKKVVIAFDSDSQYNLAVELQQEKLAAALGASIVDFGNLAGSAKGLDDIVKHHGKKALIHVIKSSAHNADLYFIPDEDRFMTTVPTIWRKLYPNLLLSGSHWYEDGEIKTDLEIEKRFIELSFKLYTIHTKHGKKYTFGKSYNRIVDNYKCLKKIIAVADNTSRLFLQNGYFDNGVFTPADRDPRCQSWGYNPDAAHPTELIDFLQKVHGKQDFRHWLSSILRNDRKIGLERAGSLMALIGAPGTGKSFLLSIAKRILAAQDQIESELEILIDPQRRAGMGNPRLIANNDLKRFPMHIEEIFTILEGKSVNSRVLYETNMAPVKMHTRFMFACVKLPYVRDTGGGVARRLKQLECRHYEGLERDIAALADLLEDPAYIERVANWALSADVDETFRLLDIAQKKELYDIEKTALPYHFCDRSLVNSEPLIDVSISDFYQGYLQLSNNLGRRIYQSLEEFRLSLERYGVPILAAGYEKYPDGRTVYRPERLGVRVNNNLTYNDHSEPVWRFKTQNSAYFAVKPDRTDRGDRIDPHIDTEIEPLCVMTAEIPMATYTTEQLATAVNLAEDQDKALRTSIASVGVENTPVLESLLSACRKSRVLLELSRFTASQAEQQLRYNIHSSNCQILMSRVTDAEDALNQHDRQN
jgi:hypothetical protein